MKLGEIIQYYRATHSMSMDEFARISGISKSYISLLEKNKHPKTGEPITPSVTIIDQAAKAMGLSFDDVFKMLNSDQEISFIETINKIETDYTYESSRTEELFAYLKGISPTQDELKMISKYRKLDKKEKSIVDFIINSIEDNDSNDRPNKKQGG